MEEDKSITDTIEIVQKEESVEKEQVKQAKIKEDSDDDDVKDAWDMSDEEEEEVEEKPKAKTKQQEKHTGWHTHCVDISIWPLHPLSPHDALKHHFLSRIIT